VAAPDGPGRLEVALGADLFEGASYSLFGQLDGRDRLVLETTLHF
jgi:hypothetical protein